MKYNLKIEVDEDYQFEDFENEGLIFLSNHREYTNKNSAANICDYNRGDGELDTAKLAKDFPGKTWAPVYAYIHGGIALSTASFSCRWDSGVFGLLIFDVGHFGDAGPASFVETWGRAYDGQVYGYTITDEDGTHVDSCWGFIGHEHCEDEARDALNLIIADDKKQREAKLKAMIKNRVPLQRRGLA